jgi:hypothetical protein
MSRRAWVVVTALGVAAGAAFLLLGRPLNALPLPTTDEPEGVGMQAAYEGRVLGDVHTGCLTLESGAAIVWPKGFYALDDPPRVMRPIRRVAVRVGEVVSMGGGFVDGPEMCGTNSRWIVSGVEAVHD